MAHEARDVGEGSAGGELFGDKGVPQVIDLGAFDAGDFEIAVDGGADVTNEEWFTRFGDKDGFFSGFGASSQIGFESI